MQKRKATIPVLLLLPFSLVYRMIVGLRNILFDWEVLPVTEFQLPVISVGNITVGGTGKTPHVEYLVELLKDEFSVATLSRGYKRKTGHFLIADQESTAAEIGDEPRQLKQKYPGGLTVAVDKKRVNGVRKLLKQKDSLDVIVLDDAYQHRYINAGKSILLINYNRLITEDFMLPAGRLREPASARKRANIILITKSPERIKPIEMRNIVKKMKLGLHQHLYFTTIGYGKLKPVFPIDTPADENYFRQKKAPVILLSGIADPRALRKYARSISTDLHELVYRDHHNYTLKDIQSLTRLFQSLNNPGTLVLTTEKDAMRLQALEIHPELKNSMYYIPIHVKFLNNDTEEFNKLILNYVRSNKRDNILHKKRDTAAS